VTVQAAGAQVPLTALQVSVVVMAAGGSNGRHSCGAGCQLLHS
jgi:hypothetical protein